ncbi:hypothetical protein PO903_08560 [Paenibacillus sp. PK4536]|uniref:Eco57I restriction-modification methylase domain-containing protein n=1 Tax=Paenibacillus sp. PK4536 TaxID=3024576 RepID=UPI0023597B64|nr:hypothetical protein [Paenibacillus sp. PK4536]WIM40912.1 hypothetical protein PO903_08560 [Paenibacillus sp. PK4536]
MSEEQFNEIRRKELDTILVSNKYKERINQVANEILARGNKATNEAEIESEFDYQFRSLFHDLFSHLGFYYIPEKEKSVSTRYHRTKGRADTSIGNLIVEFKHKRNFSNKNQVTNAVRQAESYMSGFNEFSEVKSIALVTDGLRGEFIVYADGKSNRQGLDNFDGKLVDLFVKSFIGVNKVELSAGNLKRDLALSIDGAAPLSKQLSIELFYVLQNNMTKKTQMLFEEWKELFKLSHDDESQQEAIIKRRNAISEYFSKMIINADEEYLALFALQTSYAICIKMIAFKVISNISFQEGMLDFDDLRNLSSSHLRTTFFDLEDGAIFREYGILNLLEGDFFSWYVAEEEWTVEISQKINNILRVLVRYVHSDLFHIENQSHDFFKELYMGMVPKEVRHALGEYYTPHWLAEKVVDESISKLSGYNLLTWRGLDPTCGSGTFLTVLIKRKLDNLPGLSDKERLSEVLQSIVGIDINPVTVLTARVNYFLNISNLLSNDILSEGIEIPVYSGDSAYVPEIKEIGGVPCFKYEISTQISDINIILPQSITYDLKRFSKTMTSIEIDIKNLDEETVQKKLIALIPNNELVEEVKQNIELLSSKLVEMERNQWNGIWARIITNYITTASIGKFDVIVGNPPWVDWKSLPSGYRDKIKALHITDTLFSGDGMTGGINLNICALITNVVATNWLSSKGILALLMPDTLMYQKSYEGFRDLLLPDKRRMYFSEIFNWTRAGHPFAPVQQKFYTYFMNFTEVNYKEGIKLTSFVKKPSMTSQIDLIDFDSTFSKEEGYLYQSTDNSTYFTYIKQRENIDSLTKIAGTSEYKGREGIEVYPQELMIFQVDNSMPSNSTHVTVKNIQNSRSKFKMPEKHHFFEKSMLVPLIKGVSIKKFQTPESDLLVPFAYDSSYSTQVAMPLKELRRKAPNTANYFQKNKEIFESQNEYSNKLINGNNIPYYSLARVGAYTFAENYVAFRDNSKWGACVITQVKTPWDEWKRPIFQNHAVTISQNKDGSYITNDEAHYICSIINSSIVEEYMLNSSDSRSFPIRPRFKIPQYDSANDNHIKLSEISKRAHQQKEPVSEKMLKMIDEIYLEILS